MNLSLLALPTELLTTPWEAEKALRGIKIKKAPGPDGLPNVVLKEFAHELGRSSVTCIMLHFGKAFSRPC